MARIIRTLKTFLYPTRCQQLPAIIISICQTHPSDSCPPWVMDSCQENAELATQIINLATDIDRTSFTCSVRRRHQKVL